MIMNNLLCDNEGVPLLVQRMSYHRSDMMLYVLLFNNKWFRFTIESLVPSVGLMQYRLTRMQELEAEQRINEIAEREWKKWFPVSE